MEHQQQYLPLVTVLLLLVYLKYTSAFPPHQPFFFFFFNFPEFNVDLFLNQELTAEVVRKAALTGAGHDSLCD